MTVVGLIRRPYRVWVARDSHPTGSAWAPTLGRRLKSIGPAPEVCGDVIPVGTMQVETVRRLSHQRRLIRPLQEHEPVCQVANPDRKVSVDLMRRQFTKHDENRVRIGEGQLLDEVVLAVLKVALGRGPILIAVEAPSVLREGGVHGQSLRFPDPPDRTASGGRSRTPAVLETRRRVLGADPPGILAQPV